MTALDPVNPKLAQTKFKKIREIDVNLKVDILPSILVYTGERICVNGNQEFFIMVSTNT